MSVTCNHHVRIKGCRGHIKPFKQSFLVVVRTRRRLINNTTRILLEKTPRNPISPPLKIDDLNQKHKISQILIESKRTSN